MMYLHKILDIHYCNNVSSLFNTLSSACEMASALLTTNLPDLTLVSRGKVRDIYATSSEDRLLFVATDRISVYDVILKDVRS